MEGLRHLHLQRAYVLVVTGESVTDREPLLRESGDLPPPRPAQVSFRVHKHGKKQERLGKIFANFTLGNNTDSSNLFSSQQIDQASPCSPSS